MRLSRIFRASFLFSRNNRSKDYIHLLQCKYSPNLHPDIPPPDQEIVIPTLSLEKNSKGPKTMLKVEEPEAYMDVSGPYVNPLLKKSRNIAPMSFDQSFQQGKLEFHNAKYAQARNYFRNCLQVQPEIFRKNPLIKANVYDNLGMAFCAQGQFDKARDYLEQSLEIRQHIRTGDHPDIAISLKRLGKMWQMQGYPKKSLEYLNNALKIELKTSSEKDNSDREVGITYSYLATTHRDLNDYDEALNCANKALKIFQAHEEASLELAALYGTMGSIYHYQNNWQNALVNYGECLHMRLNLGQKEHQETAYVFNCIALIQRDIRNYVLALKCCKEALGILTKIYGDYHVDISCIYNNMGLIYYDQGNYDLAHIAFKQTLDIKKISAKEDQVSIASVYHNIGLAYSAQKDYNNALENYKISLKIRLDYLGTHHDTALSCYNIGIIYYYQEKYEKAIKAFEDSYNIDSQLFPQDHPNLADVYSSLGAVYQNMKMSEKSLEYYWKGLAIKAKAFGESSKELAESYKNIGTIYFEQNDFKKALMYCQKSLEITSKCYGLDNFKAQHNIYLIKASCKTLGFTEEDTNNLLFSIIHPVTWG